MDDNYNAERDRILGYEYRLFRYTIDKLPYFIMWINPSNGIIIMTNKITLEFLGYKKSELFTRSYFEVYKEFDKAMWLDFVKRLKEEGDNYICFPKRQYYKKGGLTETIEINFKYITFEDVDYVIAFAQKIREL